MRHAGLPRIGPTGPKKRKVQQYSLHSTPDRLIAQTLIVDNRKSLKGALFDQQERGKHRDSRKVPIAPKPQDFLLVLLELR